MYCPKCYRMNDDESQFCSACGAPLHGKSASVKTTSVDSSINDDRSSIIMNIVGFFLPLIGFIMFCFMYNRTPNRAISVGKWALIGFISNIILFILTLSKMGIRIF